MKPLARWTIGKVLPAGEECLRHSVRRFRRLYPEFDQIICFNNLYPEQIRRLDLLGIPLYEQKESDFDYPLVPVDAEPGWKSAMAGWGWKLCPPRLRPNGRELWIDNDIVLLERLPTLDAWLQSDKCLISESHRKSYGSYEDEINEERPLCAGFFGLPPGFDFAAKIYQHLKKLDGRPLGYYDEQGLVCRVIIEFGFDLVPITELMIVKKLAKPYPKGFHFIGVNRTDDHKFWEDYRCYTLI